MSTSLMTALMPLPGLVSGREGWVRLGSVSGGGGRGEERRGGHIAELRSPGSAHQSFLELTSAGWPAHAAAQLHT